MVSIVLHYFCMCLFAWMFVDALHIYRMMTEIRDINHGAMKFYYVVGYGQSSYSFLTSPSAAVFLCGAAGLVETFPSLPVSGPFLPDVPGFQAPSDSVFPPQLRSSSMALPLHLGHYCNCSDVICFISSFIVPEALQFPTFFCS